MSIAERSNEVVVHEKLLGRLTKLRVSTCEAVLWEEFDKLPALTKAFANVKVTAIALAESGVGFLVADTFLWRLGGNTAVTYAEQAKKRGSSWQKWSYMSTRLKVQASLTR